MTEITVSTPPTPEQIRELLKLLHVDDLLRELARQLAQQKEKA